MIYVFGPAWWLTSIDRALLLGLGGIAGGDEAHDMCVVGQPAMTRDLEQICALSWVWDEYALEKVSCMRRDIFGESEWGGDDVLVEKVDVVTLRVRRVIVKGQVASQHGILDLVSLWR
jgi:hypothetical protein